MSKEITATQKETARKQLEKAIWGETANTLNTEKENKDMANKNIENAAFINIFNTVLSLLAAGKTTDEWQAIMNSDTEFKTYTAKAEAAARKVCEKYSLTEDSTGVKAKKFAGFCDFYKSKASAEDIAAMVQDEKKLDEFLDLTGKATEKIITE